MKNALTQSVQNKESPDGVSHEEDNSSAGLMVYDVEFLL